MNINFLNKFLIICCLSVVILIQGWNPIALAENTTPLIEEINAWDINALMTSLAKIGKGTAKFKEERYISFLSEPLIASGNLRFQSPDFLYKHTETPKDERLVIFEDEVTITNVKEGLQRSFSLNDLPQLRGILDGIRYTLAGNLEGLNKSYELTLQGNQGNWQLHLTPKLQTMLKLIREIKIFGKGHNVFKMEIKESNDDRTVMYIEPIEK